MLVRLCIENFKSFDSQCELTMISSNKIQQKSDHRIRIKSTPVLKHGVVYGANASGKTNLVDFFRFFKSTMSSGIPVDSSDMFCKNRKENKEKESTFELQLTIGDKFYAYGFSAILSKRKVTGEWLYELYQNGTSKPMFKRDNNGKAVLGSSITLRASEKNKFAIYSDDFSGNETDLFLSEMNRGKKYEEKSKLLFFRDVYQWIMEHIIVITPDTPLLDLEYYYDRHSLSVINNLIGTFDTGISDIKIEKTTIEELSNTLPKPVFESVMQHIKARLSASGSDSLRMTMRSHENFFNIKINGYGEPEVTTLRLHHDKSFYDFSFNEESDGTRRLFELMDMLLTQKDDVIYVVDELERSLHPKLTERFLQLFMDMHRDKRIQILFTTHESAIMEQSLFRRDEIWFIERNGDNQSYIYSLDQFKERYDKVLSKAYLEGRYGAVPVFTEVKIPEVE